MGTIYTFRGKEYKVRGVMAATRLNELSHDIFWAMQESTGPVWAHLKKEGEKGFNEMFTATNALGLCREFDVDTAYESMFADWVAENIDDIIKLDIGLTRKED